MENLKDKLACPRCKSKNVPTYAYTVKKSDTVRCHDCNYSQLAWRFWDAWKTNKK